MIRSITTQMKRYIKKIGTLRVQFAVPPHRAPENTIILFPIYPDTLTCGIAALVAFQGEKKAAPPDIEALESTMRVMEANLLSTCLDQQRRSVNTCYLGGPGHTGALMEMARRLKGNTPFFDIFTTPEKERQLTGISARINTLITEEKKHLNRRMALLSASEFKMAMQRLETCQDAGWCIHREILKNILRIRQMSPLPCQEWHPEQLARLKSINAILNSIDRLEVRGRDSAGISVLITLPTRTFETFRLELDAAGLGEQLKQRMGKPILENNCITLHTAPENPNEPHMAIAFVYKFAAVIGALGDNVAFLRTQIKNDLILQRFLSAPATTFTLSAHTRWASVGSISQPNCHPVDNCTTSQLREKNGIIHVSLNGDIDNYLELKSAFESRYDTLPADITTDTKIIPPAN